MTTVLDHGYLKVVEVWGSDQRIIEAARMSTDKGFLGWGPCCVDCVDGSSASTQKLLSPQPPAGTRCVQCGCGGLMYNGDEKLLEYLYKNQHATPFEFGGMVIEVQVPIFVFREWHRHRTQSYNEMSARYTPLPDLNYIPTVERLMLNSKTNKQAGTVSGAAELTVEWAEMFQEQLRTMYTMQEQLYQQALEKGVPKELARIHLPVGRYSRMRAHTCLRNWLAFMTLRQAPNAQWEIRQYANVVNDLLTEAFPRTMELFNR